MIKSVVRKLGGCLAWLALYAALTWAFALVVFRRIEIPQLVFLSSALIALMASVAVAHLFGLLRAGLDLLVRFARHEPGVLFDGTKLSAVPAAAPRAESEPLQTTLRRAGSAVMNGAVYAALALGLAVLVFAFTPLEHPAPSWEEIRFEHLLEQKVRPRILEAAIVPIPPPARTLRPGQARGRFKAGHRQWTVDRAVRSRQGSEEEIALYSGDAPAAVIEIDARGMVSMRTAAGYVNAPDVKVDIRQNGAGWIGRITWKEGQLVFRV